MIVKPATVEMLPQLMELAPRIFANAIKALAPLDMNAWVAELWRFMNLPDRRFFVATEQGRILGVHAVMMSPVLFAPTVQVVRTVTLWLHPEARGQGIGTQLQRAAEEWGKAAGARYMAAGVPHEYDAHAALGDKRANPELAEGFYESRGYERLETSFMKEIG